MTGDKVDRETGYDPENDRERYEDDAAREQRDTEAIATVRGLLEEYDLATLLRIVSVASTPAQQPDTMPPMIARVARAVRVIEAVGAKVVMRVSAHFLTEDQMRQIQNGFGGVWHANARGGSRWVSNHYDGVEGVEVTLFAQCNNRSKASNGNEP